MKKEMKKDKWTILFLLVFGMILVSIFLKPNSNDIERKSYSELYHDLKQGLIKTVVLKEGKLFVEYSDAARKPAYAFAPENDQDLLALLKEKNVKFDIVPAKKSSFGGALGLIIWIIIIIFILRMIRGGGQGGAFSFGKSRAKMSLPKEEGKITFDDVAGVEEAKEELEEVIDFLKEPSKFTKLGGKIPKGVLLMGPPGTGKTLLAKAVAGEAGVPFFSISGSEFVEMFVGVGASRVRDLFKQARKSAPCIIFIDEIDAVGKQRGGISVTSHDEREQTLHQILSEMDGFDASSGAIVIAATNRPEVLDTALTRPGRFDRQIVVPLPDVKGREGILKVHSLRVPLAGDIKLEEIARATPGCSGAQLANIINEAALLAARNKHEFVTRDDLEQAKDKVLMGLKSKSFISASEKKIIAFHEAGHALVAKLSPAADPLHKVSILPRGRALGATWQLPVEDVHLYTKAQLKTHIDCLLGGRAAEVLVFGEENKTTGAENDLKRAAVLAEKMVCEWGMSNLGNLTFGETGAPEFLKGFMPGKREKDYSEETARLIDQEKKRIIDEAYQKSFELLKENKNKLENLAKALLEKEELLAAEIDEILKS